MVWKLFLLDRNTWNQYNCVQTNNYYIIGIFTLNRINVYEFLALRKVTWSYNCLKMTIIFNYLNLSPQKKTGFGIK